jgi:exodeoxyribonuclease V alpha subunit
MNSVLIPPPHRRALGVLRYHGSPFVTSQGDRLIITRVLLEGNAEADVASLPAEASSRPNVYCPFCGALGQYRLPRRAPGSIIPHFAHKEGEECVLAALESVRHRSAKWFLLEGLRGLRQWGRPLLGRVECRRCKAPYARELLRAGSWTQELEEVKDPLTGRQPDVAALDDRGGLSFFFEVHATHLVDVEKARDYDAGLMRGIEIDASLLVGEHGECLWNGREPLGQSRNSWHLEREPYEFSVCGACRTAPEGLSKLVSLIHALYRTLPENGLRLLSTAGDCMGLKGARVVAAGAEALEWAIEQPERLREKWGSAAAQVIANQTQWPAPTELLAEGFKLAEDHPWKETRLSELLTNPYAALCAVSSRKRVVADEELEVADLLAEVQGLSLNSERYAAYAGQELARALRSGHAAALTNELANWVARATRANAQEVLAHLQTLAQSGEFLVSGRWEGKSAVALKTIADLESSVSEEVHARRFRKRRLINAQRLKQLTAEQREAVEAALNYRFSIITGGPGTGKTHVVKSIVLESWSQDKGKDRKWFMAAPTNKALQRLRVMTNTYPSKARTVHAWLRREQEFKDSPPYGLIIDEASFLDIELMEQVLVLAKNVRRLVLVGDPDQLPSIGPGAVLKDLLTSGSVKSVKLSKVHRVEKGRNALIDAAHSILQGRLPLTGDGVTLRNATSDILEVAFREFEHLATEAQGRLDDVQIIAPNRDTVKTLNERIQTRFNGHRAPIPCALHLREGDRVVCVEAIPGTGLFNGLQGIIQSGSAEGLTLRVEGESEPILVAQAHVGTLTPAYAMTVHKAQGSEWAHVLIVADRLSQIFDRNLLYTAATRAQRSLSLVGPSALFEQAARQVRPRVTLLEDFVRRHSEQAPGPSTT